MSLLCRESFTAQIPAYTVKSQWWAYCVPILVMDEVEDGGQIVHSNTVAVSSCRPAHLLTGHLVHNGLNLTDELVTWLCMLLNIWWTCWDLEIWLKNVDYINKIWMKWNIYVCFSFACVSSTDKWASILKRKESAIEDFIPTWRRRLMDILHYDVTILVHNHGMSFTFSTWLGRLTVFTIKSDKLAFKPTWLTWAG